jgi:hypothetical protein
LPIPAPPDLQIPIPTSTQVLPPSLADEKRSRLHPAVLFIARRTKKKIDVSEKERSTPLAGVVLNIAKDPARLLCTCAFHFLYSFLLFYRVIVSLYPELFTILPSPWEF